LIRYISHYGIFHGHMHSTMGHNVCHCTERYSSSLPADVDAVRMSRYSYDDYVQVLFIIELVMLQSGIIFADISSQDASFILNYVCTV